MMSEDRRSERKSRKKIAAMMMGTMKVRKVDRKVGRWEGGRSE